MTKTPLIKPYPWYWHPHKTWFDMVVTLVFYLFFPFHKITKFPSVKDNEETKKMHEGTRSFMKKGSVGGGKSHIAKWETNSKCAIIQFTCTVKRKPLLKEWDLYKEDLDDKYPSGDIDVILRFPASILEETKDIDTSIKNEYGCVVVEKLDIKKFPAGAPLILHFDGGGMTVGVHNDGIGFELVQKACKLASKPAIQACVCYSQSPEHTFPVAVEEALTAVSHFLAVLPNDRRVHLSGISAGGNLAGVSTMEIHRKYPGRIASTMFACAMFNPAANTLDYYLNTNSLAVSANWMRWCWRAYLELPENKESDDMMKLDTMEARLNYGSNYTSWNESPFSKGILARLVNPVVDLPKGLDAPIGPKFVVVTNEGDALRDDGFTLVQELKRAGAAVNYLPQGGTHWMGTALDKNNHEALVSAWKDVLFCD
jgi:acetyl esterase/lipase